jgi:hypothetical protein
VSKSSSMMLGMISMQSSDCTSMRPMQVSMVQVQSSMLTAWLVPALEFLDHLPMRFLQRIVDKMVDTG